MNELAKLIASLRSEGVDDKVLETIINHYKTEVEAGGYSNLTPIMKSKDGNHLIVSHGHRYARTSDPDNGYAGLTQVSDIDLTNGRVTMLPAFAGMGLGYGSPISVPTDSFSIDKINPKMPYIKDAIPITNTTQAAVADTTSAQPVAQYSRGGQMKTRVPKYLRDEYGRKLVRVPGWGDDDTDVYF